jgi:DNA ligase-1
MIEVGGCTMFIQPMLLEEIEAPFDDDEWIGQIKLDGMRLLYSTMNGQRELYSRHENNFSRVFPETRSIDLPDGLVLDGELIITDEDGKPDFERLKSRISLKNEDKIRLRSQLSPTVF